MDNKTSLYDNATLETVIRAGLMSKHGDLYIQLFMNDWAVESCDEQKLIMHCTSPFHCEVIRKWLLPDIENIIYSVYGFQPCVSVTVIE